MSHRHSTLAVLAAAALLGRVAGAADPPASEPISGTSPAPAAVDRAPSGPLFTLSNDGQTFLYRARPGDLPSRVANMFGIQARDLSAFLAANGITDATRVGSGFTYRIPNPVAAGAHAAEEKNAELERRLREVQTRVDASDGKLRDAQARVEEAERHAARAARIERLWPFSVGGIVVLVLALGGLGALAARALRLQVQAERYARSLVTELDEKRKTSLAERQESARRILVLETRVRELESKLGPRAVGSGRSA